jgi:ribosomal protein L34
MVDYQTMVDGFHLRVKTRAAIKVMAARRAAASI